MKSLFLILFCVVANLCVWAQSAEDMSYRRSSLYTLAIIDPTKPFGEKFGSMFGELPFPDKYNNHSVGMRSFKLTTPDMQRAEFAKKFLDDNLVAKRLVAKWFSRNRETGAFDLSYVARMGQYDASLLDAAIASHTVRGVMALDDAGEELINNTFVIVYDFIYKSSYNLTKVLKSSNKNDDSLDKFFSDVEKSGYTDQLMTSFIAGADKELNNLYSSFKVDVVFYLFKLRWNSDIGNEFYTRFWCDAHSSAEVVEQRKAIFDAERELFKLDYIGESVASTEKVSVEGCQSDKEVLQKMLTRVIHKNTVELQRKFEVFKTKEPLLSTKPIQARVGMKEGVTKDSQFEVLEVVQDENGRTQYEPVGIIEPVADKIWDNRFMAAQERALNSDLSATTFKKVKGKDFYPGMLIREIR